MKALCSIAGCEEPRFCRGWCRTHYARWWRNGDTKARTFRPKVWDRDAIIRRLMLGRVVTLSGCWEWNGLIDMDGYGVVTIDKRTGRVHRIAANVYLGMPLNRRSSVCHHCDNRKCFNPDHLFVGTTADNSRDAASKGRMLGSRNSNAVLEERDVLEIRRLLAKGEPSVQLAKRYGVSKYCISDIKRRKRWKHVMAVVGYESSQG